MKPIVLPIFFLLYSLGIQQLNGQKLYKTTWKQTGIVMGTSASMLGGAGFIENQRGPSTTVDLLQLDKASIIGFDRNTVNNLSTRAKLNSDRLRNAAYLAPVALFFSGQARENTKEILVMYAEVYSLNGAVTALTKSSVGRYRPYAYNPNVDIELKLSSTTRRSFFSGHVSHVASFSYFTATLFDDLYPNSDFKYLVWAGAVSAPAITGYLRVKAGRHFPSDVIVGYIVGASIGYFIPELHKITKDLNLSVVGADNGLGLTFSF